MLSGVKIIDVIWHENPEAEPVSGQEFRVSESPLYVSFHLSLED